LDKLGIFNCACGVQEGNPLFRDNLAPPLQSVDASAGGGAKSLLADFNSIMVRAGLH
jgi:hypothetical protein